jgi:hypothetical protein
MEINNQIFDLLDEWRHLPDYQLERRADIFFAPYLPRFLSDRFGLDIRPKLIPEFPVRLGTIDPKSASNQSCKIDYVAIDAPARNVIFVELKTDCASYRAKQHRYMRDAKAIGLHGVLEGVKEIILASDARSKRKYCCLLQLLEHHKLITLPGTLEVALASKKHASAIDTCVHDLNLVNADPTIHICYLMPRRPTELPADARVLTFEKLAKWLRETEVDDAFAARFASSLDRWCRDEPGCPSAEPR